MNTEQQVATHYTHGSLLPTILGALKQMGKDPERFESRDLSTCDELHLGWLPATVALVICGVPIITGLFQHGQFDSYEPA